MNRPSKKVLVTGAGGFIESHLTEALLRRGAAVTALVHYNARHSYGWLKQIPPDLGKGASIVLGDIRDGALHPHRRGSSPGWWTPRRP